MLLYLFATLVKVVSREVTIENFVECTRVPLNLKYLFRTKLWEMSKLQIRLKQNLFCLWYTG